VKNAENSRSKLEQQWGSDAFKHMLRGLIFRFIIVNKLIHLAQLPTLQGDQTMSDDRHQPCRTNHQNHGGGKAANTADVTDDPETPAAEPTENHGGGSVQ
jgi:hypothetical protein